MDNLEQQYELLKAKDILTKEYLRRALLILEKSKEYIDIEMDESDEFEEKIDKFIIEVKRKRLV